LHLRPVLFVGRRHMQRQEVAERVHRRMHLLAPLRRLAPS
jgi:hypothetical protein